MSTYNIIKNVEDLSVMISQVIELMVTNLTIKGITGISTNNTLSELIDKIVDVKYQPINRRRARSITPALDMSLEQLKLKLDEAHIRFRLKLDIMGVSSNVSDTFTQLANKILEINVKPQYDLSSSVTVQANGSHGEFYFNTTDALKVNFTVSDGFTLDRISGTGPANYIIRVSGNNNTRPDTISGKITITLDDGKYPSLEVPVNQLAGVYTYRLINTVASEPNFLANGKTASGKDVIEFSATWQNFWNGIHYDNVHVDTSYGLDLSGAAEGFTVSHQSPPGDRLHADNRTHIEGPRRSIIVTPIFNTEPGTPIEIYQDANVVAVSLVDLRPKGGINRFYANGEIANIPDAPPQESDANAWMYFEANTQFNYTSGYVDRGYISSNNNGVSLNFLENNMRFGQYHSDHKKFKAGSLMTMVQPESYARLTMSYDGMTSNDIYIYQNANYIKSPNEPDRTSPTHNRSCSGTTLNTSTSYLLYNIWASWFRAYTGNSLIEDQQSTPNSTECGYNPSVTANLSYTAGSDFPFEYMDVSNTRFNTSTGSMSLVRGTSYWIEYHFTDIGFLPTFTFNHDGIEINSTNHGTDFYTIFFRVHENANRVELSLNIW